MAVGTFLHGQDLVVQKDNQRREGLITGVVDGRIKIKIGPAETAIALNQIASVSKSAPKAFDDGLAAWQKGDAKGALSILKPLVETYRGLPTPWAERATAMLGDIYLSTNQLPDAEAAFAAFQKAYPDSTSLAEIGLAQLAVEKKDFATAKTKLTPIIEEASKVSVAPTGKNAAYGHAFYLMGIIHESEGDYPEALRDYLTAVTLFSEDQAIAVRAQQRADVLTKEKQVIVP
jgi:predicted Zn-dependent protease